MLNKSSISSWVSILACPWPSIFMLGVYPTRRSKVLHTYCITASVGGGISLFEAAGGDLINLEKEYPFRWLKNLLLHS